MKKNVIILSLLISIFSLGVHTSGNAANLNHKGTGQVLIYPYYTVNNNLNTLLSVVNTTSDVKALKVRFLESDNGQAVLSFNLYLGPFDVWTSAVFIDSDTVNSNTGADLTSSDTSCTPFLADPQPLLPFAFTLDPGSDNEEREREGHVLIAEMGVVSDPVLGPAATAVFGVQNNCAALQDAWLVGNQWDTDPNQGISAATGGLIGQGMIIDVAEGTAISYQAEAIDNFYADGGFNQTGPGDIEPLWASAEPRSVIVDSGEAIVSNWSNGEDAISALFMHNTVLNEYTIASGIEAQTEWVLTFPTKSMYVNDSEARAPFNTVFAGPEGACELINPAFTFFNRESESPDLGAVDIPVQPLLCWETNVLNFNTADSGPYSIFGSNNDLNYQAPYESGWFKLDFSRAGSITDTDNRYTYTGYPVTGFSVQKYTNANAQPGLLAQYATLFNHTYTRSVFLNAE